jgi:oligoendopeptidase F
MDHNLLKTEWDLVKYFYSNINDPNIEKDLNNFIESIDNFVSKYKDKIATLKPTELIEFFVLDAKNDHIISKVYDYIFYLNSLDSQNQEIIKKKQEVQTILLEQSNKLLFIEQEFKDLGYEKLIELSNNPDLVKYKNWFVNFANRIKYILDEKTERALNLKSQSGRSNSKNLYMEYTGNLVFPFKSSLLNNSSEEEYSYLTEDEVRSFRMDNDEEKRKGAIHSIYSVYSDKKTQIVIGNVYNSVVHDQVADINIRGYNSVMSERNIEEEMPDYSIELLIDEVKKAYPLYQEFLKLKAQIMGWSKIHDYNIFAPVSSQSQNYSYEVAVDLYLDCIKQFDSEFYEFSYDLLTTGKIDVYPKKGKRGGAFCSYGKGYDSMVLLNFTGKIRDISTLAHEMGHAIHGYFSQAQEAQVFNTGMCLAETASVFNETIFNNYLFNIINESERLAFLANQLEDIFATIFRQIQYISFEKEVYEQILAGKSLTYTDFNKIWRQEQIKLCGDIIEWSYPEEQEVSWSAIPHLFYYKPAFYCISYSFGNLLSFALYNDYNKSGSKFVDKYKQILRSGGSKTPSELMLEAGIDINTREFYRQGLEVVSDLLSQFKLQINK